MSSTALAANLVAPIAALLLLIGIVLSVTSNWWWLLLSVSAILLIVNNAMRQGLTRRLSNGLTSLGLH
jgi:membrane glycosyltransferase